MEYGVYRVGKRYGSLQVLDQVTLHLACGSKTCIMGPSGCGKTTLLRLMMGLEQPDEGRVLHDTRQRLGVMFQEDRLLPWATPVENVQMVCGGKREEILEELGRILPGEALKKRTESLSGGMKRRVALVRALRPPAGLLLLDEPFTGLDRETKKKTADYLLSRLGERTLVFSSHQEEDAACLQARIFRLGQ